MDNHLSHVPKKYLLNHSKLLMCFIMTSIVIAKNQSDSVRIDPDCMILKINNYIDIVYNHKMIIVSSFILQLLLLAENQSDSVAGIDPPQYCDIFICKTLYFSSFILRHFLSSVYFYFC